MADNGKREPDMAGGTNALGGVLKVTAAACMGVAALHVALGLQADALIGAGNVVELLSDGGLDSQNRFYGTAFALFGVVMWLASGNLERYAPVLAWALGLIFLGGAVRLISVALYGWPALPIVALGLSELVLPPLLGQWVHQSLRHGPSTSSQTT